MKSLKIACGAVFIAILVSNIWSISKWSEARGVYDDICYLRQAHLFERFGFAGIDTDIAKDDDHYFARKLKEIGFPTWNDLATAPCHNVMPGSKKSVMQYPPGTGLVLALFPSGFQAVPLYVLASVVAFGFALIALASASTVPSVILAAAFGDAAMYLMINPTKASYSMAPTMIACALAGFVTARLFTSGQRRPVLLAGLAGLLIGLSVNFRLPNALLSAGYFLLFFVSLLVARNGKNLLRAVAFGMAFLIGVLPTLFANAINAGSPLSTTYNAVDVTPPKLSVAVLQSYFGDVQFVLLAIAVLWTGLLWRFADRDNVRKIALLVAGNLLVNVIFFATHPVFTPYYTVPIAMLSLWTLLFATLGPRREGAGEKPLWQPIAV
jgi:hypothetical protein